VYTFFGDLRLADLRLASLSSNIYLYFQQEIQSLRDKLRKQKSSTDVVAAEQVSDRKKKMCVNHSEFTHLG
jgi:ssRNA-specific RNase YbeY (16S rRNA maturation enzyme)